MKASGILGWYPLDNEHVSGTLARDRSRNSNDGTITVGTGGLTTGIHGETNGSYEFDGADTEVDTGTDMIGTSPLTVSTWVYQEGYGESGDRCEILNNGKLLVRTRSDGRLQFYSDGATGANTPTGIIILDTWYHLCITRNTAGDETNFYIDGVLTGTPNQDSGTPIVGLANLLIGDDSGSNLHFEGKIAKVRLYSYVLDAAQVQRLYKSYGV